MERAYGKRNWTVSGEGIVEGEPKRQPDCDAALRDENLVERCGLTVEVLGTKFRLNSDFQEENTRRQEPKPYRHASFQETVLVKVPERGCQNNGESRGDCFGVYEERIQVTDSCRYWSNESGGMMLAGPKEEYSPHALCPLNKKTAPYYAGRESRGQPLQTSPITLFK